MRDPLRIELRVVRDLDGARRREQSPQGFQRLARRRVAVRREREHIEDVDGPL